MNLVKDHLFIYLCFSECPLDFHQQFLMILVNDLPLILFIFTRELQELT